VTDRDRDLRDALTAWAARERLPELAGRLSEEDLKLIPIWRRARFERGQIYLDLDNLARGPFVADGEEGAVRDHTYTRRLDVPDAVWARLTGTGNPVGIGRPGGDVGPPQGPAGPARM
jgi:hypothetical protein